MKGNWLKKSIFQKDFDWRNWFLELGPGSQIQDPAKNRFFKRILIDKIGFWSSARDPKTRRQAATSDRIFLGKINFSKGFFWKKMHENKSISTKGLYYIRRFSWWRSPSGKRLRQIEYFWAKSNLQKVFLEENVDFLTKKQLIENERKLIENERKLIEKERKLIEN